ncbi:MAG: DUF1810 domain-containing protein [Phycisphaerae bacterium]|jgi:uncharacterized protein (DUF1810 family)|nr:DUF1810 domain-containing protein [Phycisphaerae bacterium]
MNDPYNLQRFLNAQERIFESVVRELSSGQKRTHWMWYIFPQIAGLGHSMTARKYAISSPEEARAYLDHETLGPRLRQCVQLVNDVNGRSAEQIFHYPDYLKFRSSMTLFAHCSTDDAVFRRAIEKYFDGKPDTLTLNILGIDLGGV